jgi:HAE1 family hydrophobic/amphiphilic exporter-1
MKEVTAPVIATTLVLVAVFIPVASMGGITGRLYQQFAITVAVSVVFSSLNALTLSPALCSLLLRKPEPMKGPLGWFFKKFNAGFDKTSAGYMKFTNVLTRKLKRGVVFIVILSASIAVISKFVPGGFVPEEDQGYIYVNMQLPDAASLQRSDATMAKIEDILKQYEEVKYVTAVSGFNLLSGSMSTNSGVVFITLTDWK